LSDPDFSTFALRTRGHACEDFTQGRRFEHHWGRTIGRGDATLFAATAMRFTPLYFNEEYARDCGHPGIVVDPLLALCTVVGLSVEDLSEAGGPFLGIGSVRFLLPVYPDDTLSARSEVVSQRASAKYPGFGIVTWRTEGRNQKDEIVLTLERTNLVARRNAS